MSLLRNVGTIGGLTLVSRLFGFARDILLARVLGAGGVADAWQLAFQLPNLFRRLFAEGAFASAFVPLFNRHMAEGETAAKRFAGEVLAVLLPILVVFGALMMLALIVLVLSLGLTGWLQTTDAFWGEEWLQDLHEAVGDGLLIAAGLHAAAALVMGRVERTRLVKAMVTGVKERY